MTVVILAATALPGCWGQSISASIANPKIGYVRVNEPVVVDFSQTVDAKSVKLAVDPTTTFTLDVKGKQVLVTPTTGWKPGQIYALSVKRASSQDHSVSLSNWSGKFTTQPRVGIAGFLVDGKPLATASGTPAISPYSKVTITFTTPMKIETATPTLNGTPIVDAQYRWAPDGKSLDLAPSAGFQPYQPLKIGVRAEALTAKGDVATDLQDLAVNVQGIEPSNSTSQIPAGYQTQAAMLVVEDNSSLARPQQGLQAADMVYEYISEYNISRFTLVYLNSPPAGQIGPVRSCRMINTFLIEELQGIQMCSGASDGTLGWLWGSAQPGVALPGLRVSINDYDQGDHYFRVNSRPAPHNLFTDQARILRLRQETKTPGGSYVVDTTHADNGAGAAADPPSVPLQGVTYSYANGYYRPVDHGTDRIDALTSAQLQVKNVVVMHVPYHLAPWVEDVNGGANSIWYSMNGTGAAEIWSDGKLVNATWRQGTADQTYYQNTTQPVIFTDQGGKLIRLNTGLTWIHVVGDGQTS